MHSQFPSHALPSARQGQPGEIESGSRFAVREYWVQNSASEPFGYLPLLSLSYLIWKMGVRSTLKDFSSWGRIYFIPARSSLHCRLCQPAEAGTEVETVCGVGRELVGLN